MHLPDPEFPPLLKGHAVKAPKKAFEEACRRVQKRDLGAGDLVWSRKTAWAELAIVLEPDVVLERALQMAPLMMVALGDCLGSLAPPKLAVQYRWPTIILLNGSRAGDVRLACSRASLDQIPEWLVVGMRLEIAARDEREDWSQTSLDEEVGPGINRSDLLQLLAAHFLTRLNAWQDDGFRAAHDQWLFRAEGREEPVVMEYAGERVEGQVLGLDEGANLIVKTTAGQTRSLSYLGSVEMVDSAGRS
jgi:biotin-(acetyl-CoA carboxylase) ligase